MPVPIAAAAGAIAGGGGKTKSGLPEDLQGTRTRQRDLLNYLLGFGTMTPGNGGAVGVGAANGGSGPPDFNVIKNRLAGFFGPLGVPTTGLQQQSTDAIQHFLSSPGAETQAYGALQNILTGKPGQGIIDAIQPLFDRNLASANQQGNRFSSGNAILRGNAVNDFNLLGAQAAQQGIQQQIAAAQAVNLLRQGGFDRLQGAYQTGTAQAGQADIETQRRLQLILQLLNTAQSATLGGPTRTDAGPVANGIGSATDIASLLAALGGGKAG